MPAAISAPRSRGSSPRTIGPASAVIGCDRELGAGDRDDDLVEPAVAERARRELPQRRRRRVAVDAHGRALAVGAHAVDLAERLARQLERVDVLHVRLLAAGLDPRGEPEVVEQLGELVRRRVDHLDVAVGRLAERPCAASVRAKPDTVASGVRRSWTASETSRANVSSDEPMDGEPEPSHTTTCRPPSPEVRLGLSRAGVTGVQKAIRLRWGGTEKLIAAEIDCTVDLDPAQKGVHMSRFPELFEEAIDEVVIGEAFLVEELAEHIAQHIVERQRAGRAEVRIVARYPLERRDAGDAACRRRRWSRSIGIAAASERGVRRVVGVEATGINACPCAQGLVRGRAAERLLEAGFGDDDVERILELVPLATHNQRGRGTLYVGTRRVGQRRAARRTSSRAR